MNLQISTSLDLARDDARLLSAAGCVGKIPCFSLVINDKAKYDHYESLVSKPEYGKIIPSDGPEYGTIIPSSYKRHDIRISYS